MADLAPVDALLIDDFTGQPIPWAKLRAVDQNGVVQDLASNQHGRVVADCLLRIGPVHVELFGTPHVRTRRDWSPLESGVDVGHCENWGAPDRWRIPCPAMAPVTLHGPLESDFYYDLFARDLAQRDVFAVTAGELIPAFACPDGMRERLHPATTHVAALWPRAKLVGQAARAESSPGARPARIESNQDPLPSAMDLVLLVPEGEGFLLGTVTIGRPVRVTGAPFVIDVSKVAGGELGPLPGRLGDGWSQLTEDARARHQRFGVNSR